MAQSVTRSAHAVVSLGDIAPHRSDQRSILGECGAGVRSREMLPGSNQVLAGSVEMLGYFLSGDARVG